MRIRLVARPLHFGLVVSLACAGLPATTARAQVIYRCTDHGKVLYTTVPCDAGTVVVAPHQKPDSSVDAAVVAPRSPVESPAPSRDIVAPAVVPAPPPARSAAVARGARRAAGGAIGGVTLDAAALDRACRAGERRACEVRACLDTADMGACARAEGRLAGATWRELSRITHTLVDAPPAADGSTPREIALTIECVPGGLMRTVHVRPDLPAAFVRDGDAIAGMQASRPTRKPPTRFATIDAAAAFVCANAEATQPF